MPNLAVAVVKTNRQLMSNLTMDPFAGFALVANQAKALLSAFPGTQMIIAPEYFLNARKSSNADMPKVMSHDAKRDTYAELLRLSGQLGGILLVAGSVFYKKGFFRSTGLSVCPVLRNGHMVHEYYKVMNDGSPAGNGVRWGHKNTSPIFQCDGIRFGLEICGDMDDAGAALRNWNGQRGTASVDVHVVIADGASLLPSKLQSGVNGCGILTDLKDGKITVWQSPTGNWGTVGGRRAYNSLEPSAASVSQATGARILVYDISL